jgi:Immunity protein 72/Immunity protein 71
MNILPSLFGGPRPPLRPQGPAPFAQPPERDRQALFWWLKRNTSYTAIEHCAKLWAEFVAEWEKWLRSQDNPYDHLVETLKYALDTQLYYERGLKRLMQGDRSVFSRASSEGWLWKVNTGLVQRRMDWEPLDEFIDYVVQNEGLPRSMLTAYYKAHDAAMALGHGPGGYTGDRFGEIRSFLNALPFPHPLPEPRWEVSFRPGKRAPKDGIYEKVDDNGHIVSGMAYFIKSMAAEGDDWLEYGPNAWRADALEGSQQRTADFHWRLLWEDTRYKDGRIPNEERLYPTPTDSVAIAQAAKIAAQQPVRLRCEANQPCPREGYWFTAAKAGSRRWFKQGEIMPSLDTDYGLTIWQWNEQQG